MKPNASNTAKPTERPSPTARRAAAKRKKAILIFVAALVLIVAAIVLAIVLSGRKNVPEITQSTKYTVDEVSFGNVNVTISGSGTLYLTAVIGIIEGILYLTKTEEEFQATYVQAKKGWF